MTMMRKRARRSSDAVLLSMTAFLVATACHRPGEDPNASPERERPAGEEALAQQIAHLGDLHQPESVKYDSEKDVFYISNMVGYGSDKDANGYIIEVSAGDLTRSKILAESGKSGVMLDAPKGMAIHGDTLWICDIDRMRAISRTTGLPLTTLDLAPHGAVLLNDVTVGGDGAIYISDTGILMTPKGVIHAGGDKIFRISNGAVSVFAAGNILGRPNGVVWDRERNRLVVASFADFRSELYTVGAGGERRLLGEANGRFDGVEPLGRGRFMVATWSDSSVRLIGGGANARLAAKVMQPADIGYDSRRGRLAIPVGPLNQMQLWQLPESLLQ